MEKFRKNFKQLEDSVNELSATQKDDLMRYVLLQVSYGNNVDLFNLETEITFITKESQVHQ